MKGRFYGRNIKQDWSFVQRWSTLIRSTISVSFGIQAMHKLNFVPSMVVSGNQPSSSTTITSACEAWYFWEGYSIDHRGAYGGTSSVSLIQRPALSQ